MKKMRFWMSRITCDEKLIAGLQSICENLSVFLKSWKLVGSNEERICFKG
jgi:hypothetical protein